LNEFKNFKDLPRQSQKPPVPVEPSPQVQSYKAQWRPPVVNSQHIEWKPVDRVAARVVAPAKWYEEPPVPPPKFNQRKIMPDPTEHLGSVPENRVRTKTKLTKEGHRETLIDLHSMEPIALDAHGKSVKKGIDASEEMLEKAREVTAAIEYLSTEIAGPWAEYQLFVKEALGTVRDQRIALGSETRLLMVALKEVRQFFLDQTYETEINRLHEFIDLCERLKALKESGFLDTVADTILKLQS
jgi:hypothetical protein